MNRLLAQSWTSNQTNISDLLHFLGREKEEAAKETEESEGKLINQTQNQSNSESKTVKSKGHNDDDDDDDDITDLYDLAHYDSDEDLEGTVYSILTVHFCEEVLQNSEDILNRFIDPCKNGCLYVILLFIFKLASLTSFLRQIVIKDEFVIPKEVNEAILNTNKRTI